MELTTFTEEQAQYVKEVMCDQDLRFERGLKTFYHKYPRGQFSLPPWTDEPERVREEAGELAIAAARIVTPPTVEGGKELFSGPFVDMLKREVSRVQASLDNIKTAQIG